MGVLQCGILANLYKNRTSLFYGRFRIPLRQKLIVISASFQGRNGTYDADLILDTGATFTILDPHVIEEMGYSENDKSSPSTVKSPIGKETGFRLHIPAIECLGKKIENFEIAYHTLGLQHIDGLLGMNFLEQFDYCVFPCRGIVRI